MNRIPDYKGDEQFHDLLGRAGAKMAFPEARAAIMRDIWAAGFVQPSQTMEEVLGGTPSDVIPDMDTAQDFITQFLALWNHLSDHQDETKPFKLASVDDVETPDALWRRYQTRLAEVACLKSLFEVEASTQPKLAESLGQVRASLEHALDAFKEETPTPDSVTFETAATFAKAIIMLERATEVHFNQAAMLIKVERKFTMLKQEEHRRFLRQHREVGRNDSCPCGSGKKYKKCCLRGPDLTLVREDFDV